MKLWVVAAVVAFITTGACAQQSKPADDPSGMVQMFHTSHYSCKMGTYPDGRDIPSKQGDDACDARKIASDWLSTHGYCWSRGEQEWFTVGDPFCHPNP